MPKECGIYKILCVDNDSIYIGSSSNIKQRWSAHRLKLKNKSHNPKINNCVIKYGVNSFVFSIIENCDISMLIQRETYWAEYYRNLGFNLLNCGEFIDNPTRGVKLSEERRSKISEMLKGNTHTLGKKLSEDQKKRISQSLMGRKMSEKNTQILNVFRKSPKSDLHKKRISESRKMKYGVSIICLQTNKSYPSLIDAANELNISYQSIRQSIIRKGKCCGLNFVYSNEPLSQNEIQALINTDLRKNPKKHLYSYKTFSRKLFGKKIYCTELNLTFNSISEASEYFYVSPTTIRNYANSNKKINNLYKLSYHA